MAPFLLPLITGIYPQSIICFLDKLQKSYLLFSPFLHKAKKVSNIAAPIIAVSGCEISPVFGDFIFFVVFAVFVLVLFVFAVFALVLVVFPVVVFSVSSSSSGCGVILRVVSAVPSWETMLTPCFPTSNVAR